MKISVITPVYNAEKYITQAVESALQFDEVFEIILVEDQSPDNALKICENLAKKHERVKLFQHPDKGNHGAGASRNLALEKASGDFIAFLDADDYYLPNRFDAEKKLFKNPVVEGVYGAIGVHYYSEKAKEQNYKIFGDRLTTVYKKHSPKDVFRGQLGMNGSFGLFSIDGLTIRKSALDKKLSPMMKTHLRLHQDTEFLFRLSYYLDLYPGILDEAVANRGVHENNRITKVDSGKVKPSISKVLLWKEVKNWAEKEENFPNDILLHIQRMHRSFKIANAPFLKKWGMISKYLVIDYRSIRSGLYNINFRGDLF
ncbi:glycosyltransferase family 2 protein [Kaistella jeonii]|uniref:Capsular biosynthesis protein CpsI n=1 Tax=Kaistella jeonii TaxID=266749 RepID=A0A0C1CZS3_9FLAO|nr:glycosyltransferase family 2 protein [Kaistella jeonii]KIA89931.1 capsular biosynthesis protein CpsI [Kaistella jeonii]SFB80817.1 Glycosyltransferase involved in cell wall bisynthesis [Kaistella jeonii]VEI96184.1 Hyaluronan synthase [Kaistella jeonii]